MENLEINPKKAEQWRKKKIKENSKQAKALKKMFISKNIKDKKYLKIHSAGEFIPEINLVIEPLGNEEYIYYFNGLRGKTTAIIKPQKAQKRKEYFLKINDEWFELKDKPIKNVLFKIPSEESIIKWVSGEYKIKTGKELYEDCKKFIEVCLDLPLSYYYEVCTLLALLTWVRELTSSVFYGRIAGSFGSGKTVAMEVLALLFQHGYLIGDITSHGIARIIDKQKLNALFDEMDVGKGTKDTEAYRICRQGYRKNNPYVRCHPKTLDPQIFQVYSVKVFSLHSDIERALKMRGIPINIGQTSDSRLPIINMFKDSLGQEIFENIFFWYMENICKVAKVSEVSEVAKVSIRSKDTIEEIREKIFKLATNKLNERELEFLKKFKGRNVELGYIALFVSKAFGIDILETLNKSFKEKAEFESEFDEGFMLTLIKDVLESKYNDYKDNENQKTTSNGIVFVENKVIYKAVNDKLKEKELDAVSPYKFKSYLRELGFIDQVNRKKIKIDNKSVLCMLYDKKILVRLSLETLETLDTLETSETGDEESPIQGEEIYIED